MDPLKDTTPSDAPETRLHFLDYWRVIRIRKAIIITVFLITTIIATVATFVILPVSYSSTCKIKVENDVNDIGSGIAPGLLPYDPYFMKTTFEILQSAKVLTSVINKLNLNTEWGNKFNNGVPFKTSETMDLLKNRMRLSQPVPNTKLIDITVASPSAEEAATLADAIAEAYRLYRLNTREETASLGITAIEELYSNETVQIQATKKKLENLREKLGIAYDNPDSPGYTPTLAMEQVQRLHQQMIEDQRSYMQDFKLFTSLTNMTSDQLRNALPGTVHDAALDALSSHLHEAQQQLALAAVDYSDTNINITRIKEAITTTTALIDDRTKGILEGLGSQVQSKLAALLSLSNSLAEAKMRDQEESVKNQPYYDLKRDLDELYTQHRLNAAKLGMEKMDAKLPKTTMVQVMTPAQISKKPDRPNKPLNIGLGVVFGLIMGVGLAFFIEYLDTSVKTIGDVERTFQASVLGVIPQNVGYLMEEGTESKYAEAYRVLRTNLLFSRQDEKFNTIVVVSAGAGEGKSTTTANLATVFAQAGSRVLIVDSDLRRPTQHKIFKVNNNLGLTNYLLKQNTLAEIIQTTPVENLHFMASGRLPNSSMGILGSTQMKEMIAELKQRYDFIFFDSPPILGVSDASVLASEVELVVQVVQYRRYPQPMTIRARQMIEKVGGNFIGLVLNNINMSQDEGYYYYSGYYHDYEPEEANREPEAGDKAAPSEEGEIKQKY